MKSERQQMILDIISTREVETQEQLLECLRARGVISTQTTVSRDIRQLHLVKVQTAEGTYKYAVSRQKAEGGSAWRLRRIFKQGVISFDMAQNFVILKTMPGLAPAAGAAIDSMDLPEVVGSLSGNDTVMLVMRTSEAAAELCGEIRNLLYQE